MSPAAISATPGTIASFACNSRDRCAAGTGAAESEAESEVAEPADPAPTKAISASCCAVASDKGEAEGTSAGTRSAPPRSSAAATFTAVCCARAANDDNTITRSLTPARRPPASVACSRPSGVRSAPGRAVSSAWIVFDVVCPWRTRNRRGERTELSDITDGLLANSQSTDEKQCNWAARYRHGGSRGRGNRRGRLAA